MIGGGPGITTVLAVAVEWWWRKDEGYDGCMNLGRLKGRIVIVRRLGLLVTNKWGSNLVSCNFYPHSNQQKESNPPLPLN